MKNLIILFFILCAGYFTSYAQTQHGNVVIQNSGKKPLPQVAVVIAEAQPTTSDQEGKFHINLPNHVKGQRLMVQDISYKDWVVVNQHMIEQWVFAPNKVYRVDMCPQELYTTRVEQLYDIGRESSKEEYNKVMKRLNVLQKEGELSNKEYMNQLNEAQKNLSTSRKMMDMYIPEIVAINTDYLTPYEKKAQEYIYKGNILKAIEIYEALQLENRLKEYLSKEKMYTEELESTIPMLQRYMQTLVLKGGKENYNKAGDILKSIADCDTTDYKRNYEYAVFLLEQNRYEDAIKYLKRSRENTTSIYLKADTYIKLGLAYDEIGNGEKALEYYDQALSILAELPRDMLSTGALVVDLNINLASCIIKMLDKNEEVNVKGYRIALGMLEKAENIVRAAGESYGKRYISTLMTCYANMVPICRLLNDTNKLSRIQKELDKITPKNPSNEEKLKIYMTKGQIASKIGDSKTALDNINKAAELIEKMYHDNPNQYKIDYLNLNEILGAQLYDMDRYNEASMILVNALQIFEEMTKAEQQKESLLYYNIIYNLSQSYYYNKQYCEILPLYNKIYPYMKKNSQSWDVGILLATIEASVILGNYDILNDVNFIIKRLNDYADNKQFQSHVQAALSTMAVMYMNIGDHESAEILFDASDKYALRNQHNIIVTYNKLNRMPSYLMQNRADMVLGKRESLLRELKKAGGDEESITLLHYYTLLANIIKQDWATADEIFPLVNENHITSSNSEQCNLMMAKIVYNMHYNQPISQLRRKIESKLIEVKKESRYAYRNVSCDYYLLLFMLYMEHDNLNACREVEPILLRHIKEFINETPQRGYITLAYYYYFTADYLMYKKRYKEGIDFYLKSLAYYVEKKPDNEGPVCNRLYWISAITQKRIREYETFIQKTDDVYYVMMYTLYRNALNIYEKSPDDLKQLLNTIKNMSVEHDWLTMNDLCNYCKRMEAQASGTKKDKITEIIKQIECLNK